jgi:GNAT superfamily N-acetyltransferase
MSKVEMRPAREQDIPQINDIILRSKAHWHYDERYLEASRPFLAVTEKWLSQNHGYSITDKSELVVGFLGFELKDHCCYLEHLWIDPTFIGRGFGKEAMKWLHIAAIERKCSEIRRLPDPPAEGFYLNMGARFSGKKVQSRIDAGPLFQEMIIDLLKGGGAQP